MQLDRTEDNRSYQLPTLRLGPANDGRVRPKPSLDQLDRGNDSMSHYNSYVADHED